jgi:hypothetical protein
LRLGVGIQVGILRQAMAVRCSSATVALMASGLAW